MSPSTRDYKRSWRNLLINKNYQLRFTLFMVILSALLMAALGVWVMQTASEATNVAIGQVRGDACEKVPDIAEPTEDGAAVPAPAPSEAGEPPHRNVTVTLSSITPVLPGDYASKVAKHWACELDHAAKIEDLRRGKRTILYVLIATGTLLVIALAVYGIKTTHKVAGPLYKITLYFHKMRDGHYDKVWPLRKGDQLVAFYDHFRAAHGGVVKIEEADVARIRAVLAAADAGELAGASPEVDAALAELRAVLARKEKALA